MSHDNYSLSARVYNHIRDGILAGTFAKGDELKEKNIGDELGVSRTPVREALRQLELEGLCARWAATRISDELMAAMEENIYLTEFHEKKGNAKQLLELDNRFHELLYEAGGSKELMRVLKDYHEYVGRVRKVTLGETKRAKNSTHEHKQICEAIKNHDALLAEKCAREHINNSKKNMEHLGWENLIK